MKKMKVGLIVGATACVIGTCAGGFYAWNMLQDSYSSKYTLEEVNTKLMSYQEKLSEEIKEKLIEQNMLVDSQRLKGNIEYGGNANTPFGGGEGIIKVENFDFQQKDEGVDLLLENMLLSGALNMIGQQMEFEYAVDDLHFLSNGSGSYVKANNITQEHTNMPTDFIPRELIMTLNTLGKGGKYMDIESNFVYSMLKEQITDQNSQSQDMQNFLLDFLKNEPVLVAHKQEETKYHLTLSQGVCKLKNNKKKPSKEDKVETTGFSFGQPSYYQSEPLFPTSYDEFVNDYEDCSSEEYETFTKTVAESEMHALNDLFIELSDKKLHLVADYTVKSKDDAEKQMALHGKYDGVFELMKAKESSFSLTIDHENVTGSGILISQKDGILSGYLDIDMPEYNFDSNLTLSGSQEMQSVTGDYSLTLNEDMLDAVDLDNFTQEVNISGTLTSTHTKNGGNFNLKNSFSTTGEMQVSGELEMNSDYEMTDTNQKGTLDITGNVSMGQQATPMSGSAKVEWDVTQENKVYSGKTKVTMNVPNLASGEYFMNYHIDNSLDIESSFETPADIATEKSLETLMEINAKKAEKERAAELKEKYKNYKKNPSSISSYQVSAINSKVISDLRTMTSYMELGLTDGSASYLTLISDPKTTELENGAMVLAGTLDYGVLRIVGSDYKGLFGEDHEVRVYIDEENELSMYQVRGELLSQKENDYSVKGNYFQASQDMPNSLFDIEIQ